MELENNFKYVKYNLKLFISNYGFFILSFYQESVSIWVYKLFLLIIMHP